MRMTGGIVMRRSSDCVALCAASTGVTAPGLTIASAATSAAMTSWRCVWRATSTTSCEICPWATSSSPSGRPVARWRCSASTSCSIRDVALRNEDAAQAEAVLGGRLPALVALEFEHRVALGGRDHAPAPRALRRSCGRFATRAASASSTWFSREGSASVTSLAQAPRDAGGKPVQGGRVASASSGSQPASAVRDRRGGCRASVCNAAVDFTSRPSECERRSKAALYPSREDIPSVSRHAQAHRPRRRPPEARVGRAAASKNLSAW